MQARVGVIPLADPAFGFGGGVAGLEPLRLFPKRAVDGGFDLGSGGVGDGADRAEVVEMERGRGGSPLRADQQRGGGVSTVDRISEPMKSRTWLLVLGEF